MITKEDRLTQTLPIRAGSMLNTVIGRRFFRGDVKAYSTDPDCAAEVCQEILRRGYDLDFDGENVVECTVRIGRSVVVEERGRNYQEAVCRAALRLIEV
jgi:uncharacterized protein (DUF924 family)